jgi:ribonuclease E
MANKMLIDATHPEETRVVVLRGNRVEEFDFESAQRKQLRGNIYLAKVTRVEPSLQAAFVDYGGNRHGFLAFSEIHPDYYQIPVADRQALIDEEERAQRAADDEVDRRSRRHRHQPQRRSGRRDEAVRSDAAETPTGDSSAAEQMNEAPAEGERAAADSLDVTTPNDSEALALGDQNSEPGIEAAPSEEAAATPHDAETNEAHDAADDGADHGETEPTHGGETANASPAESNEASAHADENHGDDHQSVGHDHQSEAREHHTDAHEHDDNGEEEEVVESVGGADALEEVPDRAPRYRRQYKIQEVIKRRQVMLVQVVKEERGTKGAALTTYLSLAGRYSVLMPNTARGGGISRKITSSEDRARLKEAAAELEVPEGMGVILRTAGASRTKIEIKRDFEYLLRMWETVRDLTLKSTAPKLVYEEGSLVKRSIRDLYSKEIDDVIVAGTEAYHEAKDFMRMLMPSHAKNVKPYNETAPLLSRYGVENQLDAMFSPVVQLRSGGYIVLNQAEALVAIDVNSGRATREHHIEDTALKTNLEASDEIARQLRLRDLAGLIVIDYIDMEEKRNNRSVERRLKECLKHDRARIQVGRISHFGLLEMSRQRIRTSVLESSTEKCPYCGGSGHVRSVSSLALQVLRALEEQLIKGATHNLIARTRPDVALYVLNQKRAHLRSLEERFAITITISADETVTAPQAFVVDRGELVHTVEAAKAIAERAEAIAVPLEEEDDLEDSSAIDEEDVDQETEAAAPATASEEDDGGLRRPRRRRRRRGGRNGGDNGHDGPREHIAITESGGEFPAQPGQVSPADHVATADHDMPTDDEQAEQQTEHAPQDHGVRDETRGEGERRRRRGRRGGRRNRARNGDTAHDENDRGPHTEQTFTPADALSAPPAIEPELKEAVADLAAAPPEPRGEPSGERPPFRAEAPPASAPEPEPIRRRSTVREKAPVGGSADALPPMPSPSPSAVPEPVVTAITEAAADGDRPRRTGWWSRRFAGD